MTDATYVLYSLKAKKGDDDHPTFSPHVWKSILDLTFLEIPFDTIGKTYAEIGTELAKETGNPDVQVPTLRTRSESGGYEYITDSWEIAEYLEKTHGTARKSLFRSEAGRKFSKFIQLWTYSTLANELRPMLYPATHDRMDAPSQAEFTAQLRGTSTDEKDAEWAKAATRAILKNEDREKQYEAARNRLNLIESYLTSSSNPYLMGEKASHADFALFAAYAWSRANTEMAEAVWRHPSLPSVVEWLDRMLGSDFVDTKRLV